MNNVSDFLHRLGNFKRKYFILLYGNFEATSLEPIFNVKSKFQGIKDVKK